MTAIVEFCFSSKISCQDIVDEKPHLWGDNYTEIFCCILKNILVNLTAVYCSLKQIWVGAKFDMITV